LKSAILRALGRGPQAVPWNSEESIREELFSAERLEEHAESLAAAQAITAKPLAGRSLAGRLKANEAALLDAYRATAAAAGEGRAVTPAAEWLLDNYHLVEEQIREIRDDLPPGYYRQLPKLAGGPFAGYPRVFGVAWAFVAHTDSRFDPALLRRFVRAYQRVQPLTIGELWAVAITLRIVLVENLRRAARRIVASRAARQQADALAERLLAPDAPPDAQIAALLARYAAAPLSESFAVQLAQRLRDLDPKATPALAWLEERLAAQGRTVEQIVHDEHQRQGATNVTVRNIITSMRLVSDLDWPELVESASLIDDTLRPGSGFARMDFATRDLYRNAIEELARGAKRPELEVAQAALAAARAGTARERDPGYHLIAGGRRAFEAAIGYRAPVRRWPGRLSGALGIGGYIGAVFAVAAIVLALALCALAQAGVAAAWLGVLAALGLVPALDAGVALVNRAVTRGFGATLLPGLELREGIPASLRTLVAVPILLTTREALEEQLERLEIHHLGGAERELHFALLSDWADAPAETAAQDEALLEAAAEGIARLNRQYGPAAGGERFLLLHRRRVWNESQRCWMGWERKRGKLHELNRLLRGATDTTFVRRSAPPSGVRYVITLDADTRMPRDAARRLVGKMAHPLNQPRFDAAARRVVEGYGVLQPRVTPSLPVGREGSLYQRIFSSAGGIDPYESAVSDVYQDLFGEGSYTGKGIYDVDAFEAALEGRVREGTLLSHDLFEGTFARAGLASDIEVVEEFPSRYDVAAARQHRWVRGDWQLLPWIAGRAGALPPIGRWKMLDNLRRSLSAPACVLALAAGWALPLHAAVLWTGFVVSTIAVATLVPVLSAIVPRRARTTARSHLRALAADVRLALSLTALLLTFLAHQAWLMADAIGRTLYRLLVTRRRLLDWVTAEQAQVGPRLDLSGFTRLMGGGVALGGAAALGAAWVGGEAWPVALPFALAWIAAPAIARWTSLSPRVAGRVPVSPADARALRLIARRTWRYFEAFVTAEEHWLPPDNFQEDPKPVVAHRTSPTNIGVYLLSAASARDFGWAGTLDTVERLEATLATLRGLARFRGHFYNWYDTRDLRPLEPQYVSSVDSGNLAGHLIALANACREWIGAPAAGAAAIAGVEDGLALAREAVQGLPEDRRTQTITRRQLSEALDALGAALGEGVAQLGPRAATLLDIARTLASERGDEAGAEMLYWAEAAHRSIESHRRDLGRTQDEALALEQRLAALEAAARGLAEAMDFGFLLDAERKLLSIGYRVAEGSLDPSCYDLLASEARLASFVAIAKGDVASRHWFRLGRAVTPVGGGAALASWSGSMFEYLMPSLVMRAPAGSLLEQTNRLVVRRQVAYGAGLGVPWGVSESGYNVRDLELTYQYSNFGIPGLGLKRGLGENAVVAPYATALAAMVDPGAAARNFARLAALGARGRYGFYEALDYTPARLPEGKDVAIVRAFMAHHQGMTVVALANSLFDGAMRARFHAEPSVRATELLLQERTPRDVALAHPRAEEVRTAATVRDLELPAVRRLRTAHGATPEAHLLSNGGYAVMLTAAGSGYSRWGDVAVTRWREDATRDDWGAYVYLRDVESGEVWSAGHQPTGAEADRYEATFTEDRAVLARHDGAIATTLEVVVSPEDDAEVRRVSVANSGSTVREIDLTSYAELALAPAAADAAHPVFSKLFVHTEYLPRAGVILATRRRRSGGEPEIWAAHLAVVEGEAVGEPEIETDRARFLGRGREARTPMAVVDGLPLSNTVGAVLDPVFALRRRVRVAPGRSAHVAFWTVVASSRAGVLDLADKHCDPTAFERAATLAWTHAQVQSGYLGISPEEASLFQRLAGRVLYADASLRPSPDTLRRGGGAPQALWAQGISGDLPIVLVRADSLEDMPLVRQLLRAHEYWRMKQLAVDLVILNERGASYIQDLQAALETQVRTSRSRPPSAAPAARGAVYVVRADLIPAQTRALLLTIARAVLAGRRGTLQEQLNEVPAAEAVAPPPRRVPKARAPQALAAPPELEFFNGFGGFAAHGGEYVTVLDAGRWLPAPWINVVANPAFGFQAAVEGSGYTWSASSRENQLTPWSNDPVTDRPGEVLYVRDEESGELWGPTALPIRDEAAPYVARHGQGYSRFEHASHGIALELLQYVPLEDPVKISRLAIRNASGRKRKLSVTAYAEWVLGPSRSASALSIVTDVDAETGALFARNPWNAAFGSRVAFADLGGRQSAWTCDRREFLGRNGTLDSPGRARGGGAHVEALGRRARSLRGAPGPGRARAGRQREIVFLLGQAASEPEARALVARYRAADLDAVLREVSRVLGRPARHGPGEDARALDGRDAQPLAPLPDARLPHVGPLRLLPGERRLRLSRPAPGRHGARARAAGARARAPAARRRAAVRRGRRPALVAAALRPGRAHAHLRRPDLARLRRGALRAGDRRCRGAGGERSVPRRPAARRRRARRLLPADVSDECASLFEHCARGLDHEPRGGRARPAAHRHGRLERRHEPRGRERQGRERVARLVPARGARGVRAAREARGEATRARRSGSRMRRAASSLEREGWDGEWYRRGYYDDGTPLGSATSEECRIDSIAQSWSVISGAAQPERARRAMAAVDAQLVRREDEARAALRAALRSHGARSRLHQGLSAGHPGERRAVHPCRRVVGDRLRRAGRGRQGSGALFASEPDPPREHARRRAALQGRALRGRRRRLLGRAARRGAGAGPGTRAPRVGCTGRGSSRYSAFACREIRCSSIPASPGRGPGSKSSSNTAPRATRSRWKIPGG
jgi:cyclic beta-1,2-glucan synthetase